jgi:tetratricopeptide (TPR) repeat protein
LVTARGRLADLEDAQFVTLTVLNEDEAGTLFGRVAGVHRVAGDRVATRRVLVACGGLPLALRIAGARVAAWPEHGLVKLADRLVEERERLDQLAVGDLEVRAGLASSYRALSSEAQRAFRLLGTLDVPDVPIWAWPALLDREDEAALRQLDQLTEVHLVETTTVAGQPPRIRLHDLVRLYARERMRDEDPGGVAPAVGRAAAAWLALANEAEPELWGSFTRTQFGSAAYEPMPADAIAYAHEHPDTWFAAEREALVILIRSCVEDHHDELAWDLAGVSARFLELRGHYDDLAETVDLGLQAARRSGHIRGEAFLLRAKGEVAADLDEYDRAADYLQRALALSRQTHDEVNEAWTLRALSTVYRVWGRGDTAEEYLTNALATFDRIADPAGVGECHYGLGAAAREHGRLGDARHHYEVALTIFRTLEDPFNESLVLMSAARVSQLLDDITQAVEYLERALALCRMIDHPGGVAWASTYLGDLRLATGRLQAAEPLLTEAATLARRLGDRYCEAVSAHTLGRLRLGTGDQEAAEHLFRSSIDIADKCDLPLHKGRSLITLGDSQLLRGAFTDAVESWQTARELLSAHGFPEASDAERRLLTRR